ncbi:DUF433 domain-containing protein [Candidatus Protofrankia californiensis]|uniref:DUF433 domain-containing protein n=1 Tax=Candidatus Protofrankia californiensis TaxID=1839754 RepID=UPI0010414442|nr:DUF433 domain-containing protein [Candidatus Protofrankia californiensis]
MFFLPALPVEAAPWDYSANTGAGNAFRRPYHERVAFERITVDPEQMGGLPCIRGLRVTVSAVVGQLAGGRSIDEVLADYPYLEYTDVLAALRYAAAAVSERELPLAASA